MVALPEPGIQLEKVGTMQDTETVTDIDLEIRTHVCRWLFLETVAVCATCGKITWIVR